MKFKKNKKSKKPAARLTSDARPTAANVDFPVFVPSASGDVNIDVGTARLRYGTLVIELNDKGSSIAIQNMIERGVLLGMSFVMLKPDVVNEMYQDVVKGEELDKQARDLAIAAGDILHNKETGEISVAHEEDARTLEEIVASHRATLEVEETHVFDETEFKNPSELNDDGLSRN